MAGDDKHIGCDRQVVKRMITHAHAMGHDADALAYVTAIKTSIKAISGMYDLPCGENPIIASINSKLQRVVAHYMDRLYDSLQSQEPTEKRTCSELGKSREPGINTWLQHEILQIIREMTKSVSEDDNNPDISRDDILEELGLTEEDTATAFCHLIAEGFIYTTCDEDHFRAV